MGLLVHKGRIFCSRYHRKRLKGKKIIDLHDGIQEQLCGCLPGMPSKLHYDKETHEWFLNDDVESLHHALYETGILYAKYVMYNTDISAD